MAVTSRKTLVTSAVRTNAVGDLATLIGDFERSLTASNHSPRTIEIYGFSARKLLKFLVTQGMPTDVGRINREHLEAFTADQLSRFKPATASQRYRALAQFWKWMAEEGEVRDNPFLRMKPPHVPEDPVPVISDADLAKLLRACDGNTFEARRDTALIRLLIDCGPRCAGVINLRVSDVDRDQQVIFVVDKGKRGARPRAVPYNRKTATAVDRYFRARRSHPYSELPDLWLGPKGPLSDSGLRQMLKRRGAQAGIGHIYPHMFRHTFAHQWQLSGGNERDLMQIMGWRSPAMLSRYGASAAAERARESHRRLAPGDRV